LIPDDVIEFVTSHVRQPNEFRVFYYAVPLASHKFILGKTYQYVQVGSGPALDPAETCLCITDTGSKVFSQYDMDEFSAAPFKGKVAFLTGIRADESIVRLRSCINKKNENYITATGTPKVSLCKPIYDWSVKMSLNTSTRRRSDIVRSMITKPGTVRTSAFQTPLHAESAKQFNKIRTLYPTF